MKEHFFNLSEYGYQIPQGLIAQKAVSPRGSSRILILDRQKSSIKEGIFRDIVDFFRTGDVLVLNNTRVIKARLLGEKESGSKVEILLLKELEQGIWEVLVKPGKRARINDKIIFEKGNLEAKIINKTQQGGRVLEFCSSDFESFLNEIGKMPLPPYIKKEIDDPEDYQTVYAQKLGAVAAPTAGLHFTKELLRQIQNKGIKIVEITLHCSLATFRPVKVQDIRDHKIESERVEISETSARIINKAKDSGQKIIAVGTTSVRALESAAYINPQGFSRLKHFSGETKLYIIPGYEFKIVDALITNFHTPYSTNLILVSSFCNPGLIRRSYNQAKTRNFRFYSFGDAMLIV